MRIRYTCIPDGGQGLPWPFYETIRFTGDFNPRTNFTVRETNPGTRGAQIDKNALSRLRGSYTRRRVSRTVIELHSVLARAIFPSSSYAAASIVFAGQQQFTLGPRVFSSNIIFVLYETRLGLWAAQASGRRAGTAAGYNTVWAAVRCALRRRSFGSCWLVRRRTVARECAYLRVTTTPLRSTLYRLQSVLRTQFELADARRWWRTRPTRFCVRTPHRRIHAMVALGP